MPRRLPDFRAPSQYPKRRLFVRSRKVSKPRDLYLKLPDRSEIWQALRQQCCRCACQISKRYDNIKYQSRGFETSRDFTKRRLFGYWDGAQSVWQTLNTKLAASVWSYDKTSCKTLKRPHVATGCWKHFSEHYPVGLNAARENEQVGSLLPWITTVLPTVFVESLIQQWRYLTNIQHRSNVSQNKDSIMAWLSSNLFSPVS